VGERPLFFAVGDSRSNRFVVNYRANTTSVLVDYGNRCFRTPRNITIADYNNGNQLDFSVTNCNDHTVGIFLGVFFGQGNGIFDNGIVCKISYTPVFITVSNINMDNGLDIIVTTEFEEYLNVFLNYGNVISR